MELVWLSLLSLWLSLLPLLIRLRHVITDFLFDSPGNAVALFGSAFLVSSQLDRLALFPPTTLLAKRRIMERANGKTMRLCGGKKTATPPGPFDTDTKRQHKTRIIVIIVVIRQANATA